MNRTKLHPLLLQMNEYNTLFKQKVHLFIVFGILCHPLID